MSKLPKLPEMPGQVPAVKSTALERIYAAYRDENGPGLDGLSREDKLLHSELEAAYGLILNYHSFETAWPLLAKRFDIRRTTCYRRLKDAQNLFGDIKKTRKEGRKAILLEYARKLLQVCLTQRPPNVNGAFKAMKFEAELSGLLRTDAAGEESENGAGNASYVIHLTLEGGKTRQFDISQLDDITDADFEVIQDAVQQDTFSVESMQKLLTETSGKEAKGGSR